MHRLQLARQDVRVVARAEEQVAGNALEITRDLFLPDDGLDGGDGLGMAVRGQSRAVHAVQTFQLEVASAEHVRQMCRGPAGLAAADGASVEYGHGTAALRQHVGGGQPGNPGANHAHIHLKIAVEPLSGRLADVPRPRRRAFTRTMLHLGPPLVGRWYAACAPAPVSYDVGFAVSFRNGSAAVSTGSTFAKLSE